jgi:diacylglycerol kinase family enzyme
VISALKYLFTKKSNRNIIKLTEKNNVAITTGVEHYPLQIDGDYYCDLPIRVESSDKYVNMYYL